MIGDMNKQDIASISFPVIYFGSKPYCNAYNLKQISGFTYKNGAMIATWADPLTRGTEYFPYDSLAVDDQNKPLHSLIGILLDDLIDVRKQAPSTLSFVGSISTVAGSTNPISVGNINASSSFSPNYESSVVTGVTNIGQLKVGMTITGTGIPLNTSIVAIFPESNAIQISKKVTAINLTANLIASTFRLMDNQFMVADKNLTNTEFKTNSLFGLNGSVDFGIYFVNNVGKTLDLGRNKNSVTFNFIGG
jgi:hypothetical protein